MAHRPRLWLLRHAQPLVAPGLCYGQFNLPADAAASRQAAAQAHAALPQRIHSAHISPLQRCELLAQYLQGLRPDLTYTTEPRIAEINFAAWEGRAWDDIARAELDAWAARFADYAPGGGEPLSAMLARVHQALTQARTLAQHSCADVLWISHAGVARCVTWLLGAQGQRLPQADEWPSQAPAFGQLCHWEL